MKAVFQPLSLRARVSISGSLEEPLEARVLEGVLALRFKAGEARLSRREFAGGFVVVVEGSGKSTPEGLAASVEVELPAYERALVFHHTYDPPGYMGGVDEPYSYPRVEEVGEHMVSPWTFPWHTGNLGELPRSVKASQVLLKTEGGYAFLLAAPSKGYVSYFTQPTARALTLVATSTVEGNWEDLPLFAYAEAGDPYGAVEKAYAGLASHLGRTCSLRVAKSFPRSLAYLGWCTWNAFWRDVNEEKVLSAVEQLRRQVPVAMVLLDDGWMTEREGALRSLSEDASKFPGGLKRLIERLKGAGVKSFGVWLTLNGYWNGVDPESPLAEAFREELADACGQLAPKPGRAFRFYSEWFKRLRESGVDFVKVDNQYSLSTVYSGCYAVEEASSALHADLESAAALHGLDVLNCMSLNPEHFFNWYRSSVVRASIDYSVPPTPSRSKLHIYFNAYNSIWLSQLAWPDWDMFQSYDPLAALHAVARAVSGGPVYFTDEPGMTRPEVLKPLAFSDGRLPLLDAPARPTPDVVMRDPYNERVALKLHNRLTVEGWGAFHLLAALNIYRREESVEYEFKPADLGLEGGEAVVYEYFTGSLSVVEPREAVAGSLEPGSARLFVVTRLAEGLALIGSRSLYVMPAIFTRVSKSAEGLTVHLRALEPFLLYLEEPAYADGTPLEAGLREVRPQKAEVTLRVRGTA